ncbi:hypothetical protein H490_0102975 [Leucobacter sp. UCD-THU]|uniref:SpaH/EbpB family LPXTG-anchored major pilin n=1 Tax=Leucobacter sp. UCD-THU TaxID=1292023 RepID=UPI00035E171F|nr:SpaH/EbpB family LPXTG-anchored major pilin [Leucobacter sp. UCD-THU]EYT56243.1 hypothetical protein H490_0102975 [Leucobacter sp. UCD-THU]
MPRTRTRWSTALAAVAALGIGAAALVGGAAPAAQAAPGDIDPDRIGTLTVHVLTQPTPPTGVPGDGSELPALPEGSFPVKGVTFEFERVTEIGGVPVDLTTDAGWAMVQPYLDDPAALAAASPTLVPVWRGTTGGDGPAAGTVTLRALRVGLYLVQQVEKPASMTSDVQPFLVTAPMPTQQPGVFNYDIHAYPKAIAPGVVKTVDDGAAHALGDLVKWTITGNVPHVTPAPHQYEVLDILPSGLVYADDPAPTVTIRPTAGPPIELSAPGDFTIEPSPTSVWMRMEQPGLDALRTAGDGAQVDFTLATRVASVPTRGELANNAALWLNDEHLNASTTRTYWGSARVNKMIEGGDPAEQADRLAGAGFQVFESEGAARDAVAQVEAGLPVTGALEFAEGSGVSEDGKTFVTSDQGADHGFAVIRGLKSSPAGVKYWLVETSAPAGYVASGEPIEITVHPGRNPSGAGSIVSIENRQREAGALPVLGGAGGITIGAAGAILIAGGVLFAVFGRRTKTAAAV